MGLERKVRMEHKTIKIPKELLERIEQLRNENPELGYVSSTEFIKEAIRVHLNKIKK
jgi:Arc/MetJ-type ribon-helix-helix transcriptional regulator